MADTETPVLLQYLKMLPAFRPWSESSSEKDDWHAYQAYVSRVDRVLVSLAFLWPEFVERDGLILNMGHLPEDPEAYITGFREQGWSDSDIENVINHVHIEDLFLNDPDRDQIDGRVLSYLAGTIAEMWQCRLNSLYPDRRFMVGVAGEEHSPEVYVYTAREEQ